MNQLQKRLLVSSFFISVAVVAIFFSPHWLFFIIVEAFILLALNEFYSIAEKKGSTVHRSFGLFFGALVPLSVYSSLQMTILLMACIFVFLILLNRRSSEHSIVSVALTIFGIIYVAWFFSYLIKLRLLLHGAEWVFFTLLVVKGGDGGAYFVGSKFGKTKLLEHISPKKSVEGAVGQLATCLVLSVIGILYIPDVSLLHFIILGVMIWALSILGDLAESMIKRDAGVKDSGHLPGLGGMLDMLDSLIFTIPFVYFYVTKILDWQVL